MRKAKMALLQKAMLIVAALFFHGCVFPSDRSIEQEQDSPQETICDDSLDGDQDGRVDCEDPDCQGAETCAPPPEERCNNGEDDDEDGLVDCADPDCTDSAPCVGEPESCANGIDDDEDGRTDCLDPDCAPDPACQPEPEICDNGADEDGDGQVDCADPDCEQHTACRPADSCCAVHGTPGCFDAEVEQCVCAVNAYCCEMEWDSICVAQVGELGCGECSPQVEVDCTNMIDDDQDGRLDCLDSDCSQAEECACDESHESPGCANPEIQACVCGYNAYCCEMEWDAICVDEIDQLDC
jgi:hypothetical protein